MPPSRCTQSRHGTAHRAWLVAIVIVAFPRPAPAASPAGLDTEVRATWTRTPLRDWADRLSDVAGLPVIVDRRLDPDVSVTLTSDGDTLRCLLDRVADAAGGAVEPLASTVRLVPRGVVGRATAAEATRDAAVRRLPTQLKRRAERRAAWAWQAGSTPRELVDGLATEAGVAIAGLDRIPHDHLPSATLPPLTLAERLDLVLAGFDLRVDWTAEGGTILPIVEGVDPKDGVAAPNRDRQAGRQPKRPAAGVTTYSLRLEAPLDVALPAVAARLGLEASLDRESLAARGIAPGEIIRVEARDLGRDELLDAVVFPLGLSWSIDGGTLRVFAAPRPSGSPP